MRGDTYLSIPAHLAVGPRSSDVAKGPLPNPPAGSTQNRGNHFSRRPPPRTRVNKDKEKGQSPKGSRADQTRTVPTQPEGPASPA